MHNHNMKGRNGGNRKLLAVNWCVVHAKPPLQQCQQQTMLMRGASFKKGQLLVYRHAVLGHCAERHHSP
jgi:hypothetical protein